MLVQEPVQATIWHALNHYSYKSALFLAERLHCEVDSDETSLLLATCYFRAGFLRRCYRLLLSKTLVSPEEKYLLAKCCISMKSLVEADALLRPDRIACEYGDTACFAWELRGELCLLFDSINEALEAYKKALELNPFLWSCYEALCDLGEKPDPSLYFQINNLKDFGQCCGHSKVLQFTTVGGIPMQCPDKVLKSIPNISMSTLSHDVTDSTPPLKPHITSEFNSSGPVLQQPKQLEITPEHQSIRMIPPSAPRTKMKSTKRFGNLATHDLSLSPGFGVLPLESSFSDSSFGSLGILTPNVPIPSPVQLQSRNPRKVSLRSRLGGPFSQSGNVNNTPSLSPSPPPYPTAVRRSTRLGSSTSSVKENSKAPPSKSRTAVHRSPLRKSRSSRISKMDTLNERNKIEIHEKSFRNEILMEEKPETPASLSQQELLKEAVIIQKKTAEGLMTLLRSIGKAYLELAHYNCEKAMDLFEQLPAHQRMTPWVLASMGKAYFEMGKYKEAAMFFSIAKEKDIASTYMMEYYSSALWQLGKNVELSDLAQSMLENCRLSPSSWCASGNCLALERDHESAIKMFQRAIQLDERFSYAYTLLGLEYMAIDDLEKAQDAYNRATALNPRDYRAWYGLGTLNYKAEKYGSAEICFKQALSINGSNPIVACNLAVVYQAQNRTTRALQIVDNAVAINPKNPTSRYHKASILIAADRHEDALLELLSLKEEIPKESMVFFLLGKVYKKLGNAEKAQKYFNEALELDPRGANKEVRGFVETALQRLSTEDEPFRAREGEGIQRALRFSDDSLAVDTDESGPE